jgi:outer membrane lipoprotein SlyB
MNRKTMVALIAASLAPFLVASCAAPTHSGEPIAYTSDAVAQVEYGYVERVELYATGNDAPVGVGTLLSGVASGILGGPTRRLADVDVGAEFGGAANDAAVGNEIGQNNRVGSSRYRIIVRLDSGVMMTVEDKRTTDLHAGDRVRVENNRVMRV